MRASDSPDALSRRAKRYAGLAVAFLGSPLVGSVAGAIVMSWLVPGEAGMFGIMYALFGGAVALAVTLLVGLPTYCFMARRGYPLFPWFVALALLVGQAVALAIPCLAYLSQCGQSPVHNLVFALVTSVVTALLVVRIAKEVR